MTKVEDIGPYLEPVRKTITVRRTPAEAFEIFTARFGSWWPVKKFSLHQAGTETAVIEPRVGGAIYEIAANGERPRGARCACGSRACASSWPGTRATTRARRRKSRSASWPRVDGTRVELEHRDWQKLGAKAAGTRDNYDQGWVFVFETCFKEACS
jgi:hypothetical protein